MVRDAALVARKDLLLEWQSRITLYQVLPFALVIVVLFGFAFEPDNRVLDEAAPGLFWLAILFVSVLITQRTISVEFSDGVDEALRLTGLDPAAIFLGKTAATALQLLTIEVVLGAGVVLLYNQTLDGFLVLLGATLVATVGLAAASSLYAVLAAGARVRETVLPILLLPVLAPLLIAATQAFRVAIDGRSSEAWPWIGLLGIFALAEVALGVAAYGSLLEDT